MARWLDGSNPKGAIRIRAQSVLLKTRDVFLRTRVYLRYVESEGRNRTLTIGIRAQQVFFKQKVAKLQGNFANIFSQPISKPYIKLQMNGI